MGNVHNKKIEKIIFKNDNVIRYYDKSTSKYSNVINKQNYIDNFKVYDGNMLYIVIVYNNNVLYMVDNALKRYDLKEKIDYELIKVDNKVINGYYIDEDKLYILLSNDKLPNNILEISLQDFKNIKSADINYKNIEGFIEENNIIINKFNSSQLIFLEE